MSRAINLMGLCEKGHLPQAGGLIDQPSWFISAWQLLLGEQNGIENERQEKERAKYGG